MEETLGVCLSIPRKRDTGKGFRIITEMIKGSLSFTLVGILVFGYYTKICAKSMGYNTKSPIAISWQINGSSRIPELMGGNELTGTRIRQSVQDSENVSLAGRWPIGPILWVTVSGHYAYTTNGGFLDVLDISDPEKPDLTGQMTLPSFGAFLMASDEYVYTIGYNNVTTLTIIDASDPTRPREAGSLSLPEFGVKNMNNIQALSGKKIYMVCDSLDSQEHHIGSKLIIIDVSEPGQPRKVGTFYADSEDIKNVAVSGRYAYIACQNLNTNKRNLEIIDVNDPKKPNKVGGPYPIIGLQIKSMTFSDGYVYLIDNKSGLQIIDANDPTQPHERGSLEIKWQNCHEISVSKGYAYITFGVADTSGLSIIDVSNPDKPYEAGHYNVIHAGVTGSMAISNGYAYVAQFDAGLHIIDVRDPEHPKEAGFYDKNVSGLSVHIEASNGYAYVIDLGNYWFENKFNPRYPNHLRIMDVGNPANPQEQYSYNSDGEPQFLFDAEVLGNYAYAITYTGFGTDSLNSFLKIINVSDPAHPLEVGSYNTEDWYFGFISVEGKYAYFFQYPVAETDTARLGIIDISNHKKPREVGYFNIGVQSKSFKFDNITASGNYVYVYSIASGPGDYVFKKTNDSGYNRGLAIIDVSDTTNPKLANQLGWYEPPSDNDLSENLFDKIPFTHAIAVSDGYAYIADPHNTGLKIVDVREPYSPLNMTSVGPDVYSSIAVSGKYAYVTSLPTMRADTTIASTLKIIDVSDPTHAEEAGFYNTYGLGLINVTVSDEYVYATDLYTGLYIFKNELLDTPVEKTPGIPPKFAVSQNYPNPFNPVTNIRYTLPASQHVSLRVYNILGQLVATLVDKDQSAGSYTVQFNAHDLSSGMYFYHLQAGSYTRVKKMMLIK